MTRKPYLAMAVAATLMIGVAGCSSDNSGSGSSSAPSPANAGASASSGASGSGAAASSGTAAGSGVTEAKVDYNPQPYDNLKDGGTYTSSGSFDGDDTQGLKWNVNASLTGSRLWNWYSPVAITFSPSGEVQINKDYYTSATAKASGTKEILTITINQKAVYNDGKPIDWHSIEQTWKVNNGTNKEFQIGSTTGFDQIESVKQGVDAKQAIVTFKHPYSAWPALFSSFINPEAATVENFNGAYSNKVQPNWGAGPFTVESYDPNSKKLIFARNPKWWGQTAKLDKRIYLDIASSQAAVNAFKNGQLDYTSTGSAETRNQISGVAGTEIRQGGSPFEYSLFVNGKSPLLSDVNVRKAVLSSVDRAEIAKVEFQGLDYTEPLPGSALYYSFQKGYQDNLSKVLTFSNDEAGKILDAAGWKPGSNGIREKDGAPLALNYILYSTDPLDKAVAGSLTASLKKSGILLNIKTIDSAQWSTTINGGKFDLILSGNRSTDPFGSFGLSGFYGSTSESNITGIGTPALDKEIAAVNELADPKAQIEQANVVEQHALALYGVLPLFSGPSIYGVKKGLANVGATIFGTPLPETLGWQK